MRKEVMMLLIVSLLTSCYNMSQSDLPKVQPSKAPIVNTSIKPTQVKPSTIAVNQGNPVTTTNSNTSTSTVSNTSTVVVNTPVPSPTVSPVNNSSSTTNLSSPDSQTITFNPNPTYNYPPPSLSPDVPRSTLDGTQSPPPRPKITFQNREIPTSINYLDGNGLVIFKDEFKIRIQTDATLYSQTGVDMSSINKLISDYKVKVSNIYLVNYTQDELDKREREMEAIEGVDIPNEASIYKIEFTNVDTNVKEFLEKMRTDPKIWIANWVGRPMKA